MRKGRRGLGIISSLVFSILLVPAGLVSGAEKTKLKFAADWAFYGAHTPFFVALEKGYYKDRGLNVTMTRGYGASDSIKRVTSGQADIVFGDTGATILGRTEGAMNKLVAVMYEKAPYLIYTLKKSGLTTPKDLVGKTIAAAAGDINKKLFPVFAKKAGINPCAVKWLTVAPAQKTAVLLAKKVDGATNFITLDPVMNMVTKKLGGYNKIVYANYGVDIYSNGIVVKDEFAAANPKSLRGFVQAVVKAYYYTFDHPDESTKILLKAQPHLNPKLSRETVDILRDHLVLTPAAKKHGIGHMTREKMVRTRDTVLSSFGKDPKKVRIEDTYTDKFLK